jgi:hypothetical protein
MVEAVNFFRKLNPGRIIQERAMAHYDPPFE